MTFRSKINALAVMVIAAGGVALSNPARAEAAAFDCTEYERLRQDAIAACAASGGSSIRMSGWCSPTGHELNTTCIYPD
jgi:hypothetical protein